MNPFALIPLLCFFICVSVAAFVFFRDSKRLANRFYVALSMAMSLQALIEFGYRQSQSFEQASFWWHVDLLWPLSPPLLVLFVLALADQEALVRKRTVLISLFGPAVALSVLDGTTHLITGPPIQQMWGWSYGLPVPNLLYFIGYGWIVTHCFAALGIGLWALYRAERFEKQGQLRFTLLGIMFVIAGAVAEPLMKTLGVKMPPFYVTSLIVGNLFVSYAIWKYKLFQLSPSNVAADIVETMTDALFLVRPDGRIAATNRAASEMFQTHPESLIGTDIETLFAKGADRPLWLMSAPQSGPARSSSETTNDMETAFVAAEREIPVSLAGNVQRGKNGALLGYLLIVRDVTERRRVSMELSKYKDRLEELIEHRTQELLHTNEALKGQIQERIQAEEERAKLEAQLHQSQKMEAVGRLAGGVAHDFNNLLTVITTYSDLLMLSVAQDDPMREDLCEIREATRRATALTQQLLTFSRKQVVEPKIIDLNAVLISAEKMLGRIIGEDVTLVVRPHTEPLCAHLDPVQIEQVLANLVVNARDAIPCGGNIIASSRLIRLTAQECVGIPEASEGEYTVLSVKDNGCGMDEDTLTHIFEPFFTTKEKGKGTGLGLSTVYGIVKQNQGFIRVDTAPGRGTTFDVYLPRVEGAACEIAHTADITPISSAQKTGETILLVEDEDIVRRLTCNVLKKQGYKVFEAHDARRARQILAQCRERVDLLLTDVVMPGQNGKQLSEEVRCFFPEMRVLFMSGYNDEIIDQHGLLHPGIHLIQKPFSSQGLSRKIREVLEAGIPAPPLHRVQ